MLSEFMLRSYEELRRRLTHQLGNPELASDALHDTWLRLENVKEASEPVQYPLHYLLRMASNIAIDRLRSERRFLSGDEVEALFATLSDQQPGPAQIAEGRSEAELLACVMRRMPARRRMILTLVRVDQMGRQEVADRLGISLSLVDRELRVGHEHLVKHMR